MSFRSQIVLLVANETPGFRPTRIVRRRRVQYAVSRLMSDSLHVRVTWCYGLSV
jgi:hypothetical protein